MHICIIINFLQNLLSSTYTLSTVLKAATMLSPHSFLCRIDPSRNVESRPKHSRIGKVERGIELEYVYALNPVNLCNLTYSLYMNMYASTYSVELWTSTFYPVSGHLVNKLIHGRQQSDMQLDYTTKANPQIFFVKVFICKFYFWWIMPCPSFACIMHTRHSLWMNEVAGIYLKLGSRAGQFEA